MQIGNRISVTMRRQIVGTGSPSRRSALWWRRCLEIEGKPYLSNQSLPGE